MESAIMVQVAQSSGYALRSAIYRAASNPVVASAVYGAALRCRQSAAARAPQESLPLFDCARARARARPAAQVQAYDLAVALSFLGPEQAARAQTMLGPARWRLVQRLGGWRALHRLPRLTRAQGLVALVEPLLRPLRREVREGQAGPQVLTQAEAEGVLEAYATEVPALLFVSPRLPMSAGLTLGSFALLVDRVVAAALDGLLAGGRVTDAVAKLVARCPGVG